MTFTSEPVFRSAVAGLLLLGLVGTALAQKEPLIETMSILEVWEKAAALDQTMLRLTFDFRGEIVQVDSDKYYVQLYDTKYNELQVEFSKEALNFFKKLVQSDKSYKKSAGYNYQTHQYQTKGGSYYVYLKGRLLTPETTPTHYLRYANRPMLIFDGIGKSQSKDISGNISYKW